MSAVGRIGATYRQNALMTASSVVCSCSHWI